MQRRQIADTDIYVSPVALGCWPLTGMTSLHVTVEQSKQAIAGCLDLGINFFDTAYMYGANGESELYLGELLKARRSEAVIATKGGLHWGGGVRVHDATPKTIRSECEESLRRLQSDYIDIYFLHAPDPSVPIEETAAVYRELRASGKIRAVGVSNLSLEQTKAFNEVCPIQVIQPPYNMLYRGIEEDLLPWCLANDVSITCYWPLMKGLLAGKLTLESTFPEGDSRQKYPFFHGEEFAKSLAMVDKFKQIAQDVGRTVAQVVINWTIQQPGITSVLCGAKRLDQVEDNAGGMGWELTSEQLAKIDLAIKQRGTPVIKSAI
ncbi:MAG: aldo/keto reductase [Blastopirellula sp.]|nr:MAG: aldo/keto reductase [Blastopirellula sp.]